MRVFFGCGKDSTGHTSLPNAAGLGMPLVNSVDGGRPPAPNFLPQHVCLKVVNASDHFLSNMLGIPPVAARGLRRLVVVCDCNGAESPAHRRRPLTSYFCVCEILGYAVCEHLDTLSMVRAQ